MARAQAYLALTKLRLMWLLCLATTAYAWSYDLRTAVNLVTVGLLYVAHRHGRS